MNNIVKKNAPSFNEPSIKKLWTHFKNIETIASYIPDYQEEQFPEIFFFQYSMNTLPFRSRNDDWDSQ